jgi:MFS family permease
LYAIKLLRQVIPISSDNPRPGKQPVITSGLTNAQIRKSLKNSIYDGSAYASMQGLTQNYTTPYALAMNASTTQIGFLAGIPALVMLFTQLVSPILVERIGSRKRLILLAVFFNGLMWLPILLIPYLFHSYQVWWLIAFLAMCTAFDALCNAPWNSMMADLVPEQVRGRYFSSRNRINGLVALVLSFIAGGVLQALTGNIFLGFAIIFAGAMVSRISSVYFVSQMVEPTILIPKSKQLSIFRLSLTLGSTNAGKFILYNALMSLAVSFSSPFFAVYMLRDLKFSYLIYVAINSAATLSTLIFMPFWGKRIDRYGNAKILKTASLFVPLIPILWLFSFNIYYLCGAQVFSGLIWAGFSLAGSLFLYDAAPPENRTRYMALGNALVFAGAAVGSLLGGVVAPIVPAIMRNSLLTIFLISGVLRIVIVFLFAPHISEVRKTPKANMKEIIFDGINLNGITRLPYTIFRSTNKSRKK